MTRLLTEAELPLMHVLWDRGEGRVRDVLDGLSDEDRAPAYTTVATLLRILVDKGFVEARRDGRAWVYSPAVPRDQYERRGVRHLVSRLFGGDRVSMVRSLVDDELSADELDAFEALVRRARENR